MRMPSSVMSVSPVSSKLGLAPVLHTLNNSCDLVLRDQHQYLLQHCIIRLGYLHALLCVGPSVQKCHIHVKSVDLSDDRADQSMSTTLILFLLILVMCVLIWHCHPRPGTVTGYRTKRQDNRHQHLLYVHLTDQVSLYNHQICRPWV